MATTNYDGIYRLKEVVFRQDQLHAVRAKLRVISLTPDTYKVKVRRKCPDHKK
jgi:hypothetical protein